MREMVLNHTSITTPDQHTAVKWLKDIAVGMAELRKNQITLDSLRMSKNIYEISCLPNWSLYDAYNALRQSGARDEYGMLMRLAAKIPLMSDVGQDIEDRFPMCEEKTLSQEDGKPLLFCALTNGVAVGFPSDSVWDRDTLKVQFNELLPDDSIKETSQTIDNLARSTHATHILERHRTNVRSQFNSSDELWNNREVAFQRLVFISDVKRYLDDLDSIALSKVSTALNQMEAGNLSNAKSVGGGVTEFRINFGPGYRIYFGSDGDTQVILLCGTKQHQNEDIQMARILLQNYNGSKS